MQNNNWRMSDWQQRGLSATLIGSLRPRTKLKLTLAVCGWMLLVLALLLSGCQTRLPQPPETQPLPRKPALSEPTPLESYSKTAQMRIEMWLKKLTDMQQTPSD